MLQNADHTFSHIDEASEVRLAGLTDSVAGASFVEAGRLYVEFYRAPRPEEGA